MAIGVNWKEVWKPVWDTAVWDQTAGEAPIGVNWDAIWKQVWGPVWQASTSTATVITAVDPVSGTELSVTWTGTASRYRLDGGTAVALVDTTSPATISGLTPNTQYAVELDNGDGNWSNSVSEWTDNTGSGGGDLAHDTDSATLAGAGAVTAGSASRTRVHAASGALAAAGAVIVGIAARSRTHAASGVLAGAGAAVSGAAEIALPPGAHSTAGTLVGAGAAVAGTATVRHVHAATGVMVGAGAAVAGASSIRIIHAATGALAGAGAQVLAYAAKPTATGPNSAPPSGHGPAPGRRGWVTTSGRRGNLGTRTR